MSGAMIEIGRLNIALHGVSAEIAQAAVAGLEAALRRRLGPLHAHSSVAVPELRVDTIDLPPEADASALRDLIADRLVEALGDRAGPRQQEEVG